MMYDPDALDFKIREMLKLLNVIEDMQSGDDEDDAYKKNGMNPQDCRNILAVCLERFTVSRKPSDDNAEIAGECNIPNATRQVRSCDMELPNRLKNALGQNELDKYGIKLSS